MCEIGYMGLGTLALGNVDDRRERRRMAVHQDFTSILNHVELAAVGGAVTAHGITSLQGAVAELIAGTIHPNVADVALQKLLAFVPVKPQCSLVDVHEAQGSLPAHVHRRRVLIEERPKQCLAGLQLLNIRERDGKHAASNVHTDLKCDLRLPEVVTEFEARYSAARIGAQEPRRDFVHADPSQRIREQRELKAVGGRAEKSRRRLVYAENIEIRRRTIDLLDRAQPDDAFLCGVDQKLGEVQMTLSRA